MPDGSGHIHVLITVPFDAEIVEAIRAVSDRVELHHHPAQRIDDVPDDIWRVANVLYTHDVVPDPALAPQLRWVHAHNAGIDHLLDQPILGAEGVLLTTSSGIHAPTMAEYVFMMLLAFGHCLPLMLQQQAAANWPADKFKLFVPRELRGSTLGIVGYGSLGREIARLAHSFGMEVLAVKRDVRQPAERDGYVLPGTGDPEGLYFHRLYPPEALITMVRAADFVVLTVPLTESTRRMVNAEVLAAMKPSAVLVNVSRGGVIDEAALSHALQTQQIAGAALDVFETEPLPADSPLWKLPNLIISPHVAGNISDYNAKAAQLFIANLERYLARKDLFNQVDRTRGY